MTDFPRTLGTRFDHLYLALLCTHNVASILEITYDIFPLKVKQGFLDTVC